MFPLLIISPLVASIFCQLQHRLTDVDGSILITGVDIVSANNSISVVPPTDYKLRIDAISSSKHSEAQNDFSQFIVADTENKVNYTIADILNKTNNDSPFLIQGTVTFLASPNIQNISTNFGIVISAYQEFSNISSLPYFVVLDYASESTFNQFNWKANDSDSFFTIATADRANRKIITYLKTEDLCNIDVYAQCLPAEKGLAKYKLFTFNGTDAAHWTPLTLLQHANTFRIPRGCSLQMAYTSDEDFNKYGTKIGRKGIIASEFYPMESVANGHIEYTSSTADKKSLAEYNLEIVAVDPGEKGNLNISVVRNDITTYSEDIFARSLAPYTISFYGYSLQIKFSSSGTSTGLLIRWDISLSPSTQYLLSLVLCLFIWSY